MPPNPSARGDRADRSFVLAVLTATYTLAFVDRQILSLLVEPIKATLHLSDTEIGLLQGVAFALSFCLLSIPIGRLADRHHRVGIIAAGVSVWSISTALLGLSRTFPEAFACRLGVGAGEAAVAPASVSLLSDYYGPVERGFAMGVFVAGAPAGAAIALLGGGALIIFFDQSQWLAAVGIAPWQAVLLSLGLLPGVLMLLLLRFVREPERGRRTSATATSWEQVLAFIFKRRLLLASHVGGIGLFTVYAYGTVGWAPTLFMRHFGWTPGFAGVVIGLIVGLAGTAGAVMGGYFASQLRARGHRDSGLRAVAWGLAGLLLPAIATPLAPTATISVVLLAVSLFFMNFLAAPSLTAIQEATPSHLRAQLTAAYFVVIGLVGLGLGAVSVGVLTDAVFGDEAALRYSMATLAAIVLPLALSLMLVAMRQFRRLTPLPNN